MGSSNHSAGCAINTDSALSVGERVPSVAVCIPTFRNPDGLGRLLDSIKKQRFYKVKKPNIAVFVADNDPKGSAGALVEQFRQELPFPLKYCIEENRGIPFVRNRLVTLASDFDLIAFIDDDEEAEANWLDELLYVRKMYSAQVVSGPVLAKFEVGPPQWAVVGGFYESPRRPTGSRQDTFYTNNVLIERTLLDLYPRPFEESMAFTGGTDTLLAMRIAQTGASLVWADCAVVYESVPPKRLTMRWYFRRRYRVGNALVLCDRFLPRKHHRVRAAFRAVRLIILGVAVVVSASWRGSHKVVRGVGYVCQAAGMMAGAMECFQGEYARDDYR